MAFGDFLQGKNVVGSSGQNVATPAFASSVALKNLIVVAVEGSAGQTLSSVTDSLGNPYTLLPGTFKAEQSNNYWVQLAYTVVEHAGANNVVTAHYSASTGYANVYAAEFATGGATVAVDVATGQNWAQSSTPTFDSTLGRNGELCVAALMDNGGNSGHPDQGAGWTVPFALTSYECFEYRTANAGTLTTAFTMNGDTWSTIYTAVALVTFQQSVDQITVQGNWRLF